MRFLQLEAQVVIYLFVVLFNIGLATHRQLGPSALLEALNISKNKENTNFGPSASHGFQNRRYPSSLSCFSNCPFRQGVLFLGGPCGPMKATCCGGFGCASGIGFPISTVCCKLLFVSPLLLSTNDFILWSHCMTLQNREEIRKETYNRIDTKYLSSFIASNSKLE